MELIDLSPIKPMLMRALANPEAIKTFINFHLGLLGSFGLLLLHTFIICSLGYIAYLLREHKVRENKNKQERKTIIKNAILEYLRKVKRPLRKLRYLIIGFMLIFCAWLFVSMIFYIYRGSRGYNCSFSPEENQILGYWSFLSLIIFLIAPLFIMFCFGNKFIHNIGILIYIFGIGFIAMGKFISIGCAGMGNEEESEKLENIENLGGIQKIEEIDDFEYIDDMEKIGELRTETRNDYNLLPDSAEISVEHTKIIEGEAVNLLITIMKDGKKMDNYDGTVLITIKKEDGTMLSDMPNNNEYSITGRGIYTFLPSDLGKKEFQKGLTINKAGEFYIEVIDLNDFEDKVLGRQKIEVIKKP